VPPDDLVPDPAVCREFDITLMTLWRWDHDPELNFPLPVKIRQRKFRSRRSERASNAILRDQHIAALVERLDAARDVLEGVILDDLLDDAPTPDPVRSPPHRQHKRGQKIRQGTHQGTHMGFAE
jgi:hypothetical protein